MRMYVCVLMWLWENDDIITISLNLSQATSGRCVYYTMLLLYPRDGYIRYAYNVKEENEER